MLVWTPHAREQRSKSIDFIAQSNPVAALEQLDEIEKQTDMLLQHPGIGRRGRSKGTRELVISRTNFIVVYRINAKTKQVVIVRFLHTSQAWPA